MARNDMTVRVGGLEVRSALTDESAVYLRTLEADSDGDVFVDVQDLYDAVMFVNGDAIEAVTE